MGDALQSILNGVGKVVHGVDAPLGTLPVVIDEADAVDDGVTEIQIAAGQIDLGPEGHLSLLHLTVLHLFEQPQIFLDGPIPIGGGSGDADVAPVGLELLWRQLADVGQPLLDELHGILVVLLEVVGAVEKAVAPVKAQPMDILLDGVHVLGVLLSGVGVIHAEVAETAELLGGAEVDAQGLAVADVQVAVGLRREAGVYGHALVLAARGQILGDEIIDKVAALGALRLAGGDDFGFLAHMHRLLMVDYRNT